VKRVAPQGEDPYVSIVPLKHGAQAPSYGNASKVIWECLQFQVRKPNHGWQCLVITCLVVPIWTDDALDTSTSCACPAHFSSSYLAAAKPVHVTAASSQLGGRKDKGSLLPSNRQADPCKLKVMAGELFDPSILANIERQCGVSLKESPPEALRFVASQSKTAGNRCFKEKKYKGLNRMVLVSGFWLPGCLHG
jgi:hypothetical protein